MAAAPFDWSDIANEKLFVSDNLAGLLGDARTSIAEDTNIATRDGYAYTVAASEATDQHVTTAGGVKLYALPINDSFLTPVQFGCVKDGVTDDGANLSACLTYAHQNGYAVNLGAGNLKIGARATPLWHYDRDVDGALNRFKIKGEGPTLSTLTLTGQLDDFLFKVTGVTDAYADPHASWIDFEDFGITGNGSAQQDLFAFTCADRVNIRNVQAYNCKGYGIYAREWWDSLCDVRLVRCGDATAEGEKAVVDLDYFFAGNIADSSCNNIIFTDSTQIESYRYQALRMGTATRRIKFMGKIHYWIGETYTAPAVYIDGGVDNSFPGARITHAIGSDPRPRDIVVENNGWIPARNIIQGASLGGGIDFLGDCRQNIVKDSLFDNGEESCVYIAAGSQNIVKDNIPRGTGPEVEYVTKASLMPQRIHSALQVGPEPASGWSTSPLHVFDATNDNVAVLECGDFSTFLKLIDTSSTTENRIGVQGNNIRAQKDGVNQANFNA